MQVVKQNKKIFIFAAIALGVFISYKTIVKNIKKNSDAQKKLDDDIRAIRSL